MVMSNLLLGLPKDITAAKPLCKDRSLWLRPQEGLLHKLSSGRNTEMLLNPLLWEVSKGSVDFRGANVEAGGWKRALWSPSSWVKNRKLPQCPGSWETAEPAQGLVCSARPVALAPPAALWALKQLFNGW